MLKSLNKGHRVWKLSLNYLLHSLASLILSSPDSVELLPEVYFEQQWVRNSCTYLCSWKWLSSRHTLASHRPGCLHSSSYLPYCRWLACLPASIKPQVPPFSLRHSSLVNFLSSRIIHMQSSLELSSALCLLHNKS